MKEIGFPEPSPEEKAQNNREWKNRIEDSLRSEPAADAFAAYTIATGGGEVLPATNTCQVFIEGSRVSLSLPAILTPAGKSRLIALVDAMVIEREEGDGA